MTPPQGLKAGYHHGDLRRALLDAAMQLIREKGVAALSLRETARTAGVTHNAPYRHFPEKGALLAAIAEEGFVAMRAAMLKASAPHAEDPEARFLAIGLTYVRYALGHPDCFRVMFGPETADRSRYPAVREAEAAAFRLCVDAIRDCQAAALIRPGPAEAFALTAWATMHGIASLALDDFIRWTGVGEGNPNEVARLVATVLFQGLAAQR